jgi:hydroxyacylglutathione hydrolase
MFGLAGLPCPIDDLPCRPKSVANRYILPKRMPPVEPSFVKPSPQIVTVLCHPFEQNSYVAWIDGRDDCVIVDPGLEPEKIIRCLQERGLTPAAMLNTHGHSDHIGGNAAIKKKWPDCPIVIGAGDADKLTDPWQNLSGAFGVPLVSPPADVIVNEGDVHEAAGCRWQVRHIPGHTAGHVVFQWDGQQPPLVFVGDVIFAGSIGRTDFPDGDHEQLISGIRSKLFTLPDDTILLPGHGSPTTVGEEKQTNPFAGLRVRM